MSATKAALKAAKSALDSGHYEKAAEEAQKVLSSDSKNYFALLFLGRAYEKQSKVDDASKAYRSAADAKPDDSQAWLGLCSLYETQGSKRVDEYREVAVKAADIFANADDRERAQTTVEHGMVGVFESLRRSGRSRGSIFSAIAIQARRRSGSV